MVGPTYSDWDYARSKDLLPSEKYIEINFTQFHDIYTQDHNIDYFDMKPSEENYDYLIDLLQNIQ